MTESPPNPAAPERSLRLLRTKLFIPHSHPDVVRRPRLFTKLDGIAGRKLAVISAPAGSGKSTLVSAWIDDRRSRASMPDAGDLRFGWLSLDDRDNDPARFWSYFIAALQTLQPGLGAVALSMLQSLQPPPLENLLTEILNDLGELPGPALLVLDDYHAITAQPVHAGLAFLLENLPPGLHLIISSRVNPPLPLPQYRVRRELVEIGAEELRFTKDEAAAFLEQVMGLDLTGEDIAALDRLTEGWAAGLQLAALSMQGEQDISSFIQSFSGSHRYVFDYLAEEVLNRQPADIRSFLTRTSVLDRLSGPLCDALLFASDEGENLPALAAGGQAMLERLETANLFLVPLDSQRQWYRYHHLFSNFLQARLEAEVGRPGMAGLQRAAGQWFEQQGLLAEAIGYALQAQDFETAAQWIRRSAIDMFRHSQLTTLQAWLEALPPSLVSIDAELSMILAWVLLATSQTEAVEPHLQDVERLLSVSADGSPASLAQPDPIRGALAEITCIRTSLAFNRLEMGHVLELCDQAQAYLGEDNLDGLYNSGASLRGVIAFNQAIAYEYLGRIGAASEAFKATIALSPDDPHLLPMAYSHLAQLQLQQGQLRQAESTYREAMAWVQRSGRTSPLSGMVYTGLGGILGERNELEQAEPYLQRGIELGRPWNQWESLLAGYFGLARTRAARGDLPAACRLLQELANLAERLQVGLVIPAVSAEQALLVARTGDLDTARQWAQGVQLPPEGEIPPLLESTAILLARLFVRMGQTRQALELAERVLQGALDGGRNGRAIEVLIIQALALSASGQTSESRASLLQALSMAEPEGYRRVFLDEGEELARLLPGVLEELKEKQVGSLGSAETAGNLTGYIQALLAAFNPGKGGAQPTSRPSAPGIVSASRWAAARALSDRLSERELEVLRLVAQGMTNQDIAETLVISLNTVKTHVKNILGTLEVENRTQATARARELGLL